MNQQQFLLWNFQKNLNKRRDLLTYLWLLALTKRFGEVGQLKYSLRSCSLNGVYANPVEVEIKELMSETTAVESSTRDAARSLGFTSISCAQS